MNETLHFIDATKTWLSTIIIAHNICPFAKRVFDEQSIHFTVNKSEAIEQLLLNLIAECELLNNDNTIETSLLIYSKALTDFDDYLDFLALAEDLLIEQGYEGIYQLASFHPDYCFEGVSINDASNYTNRSPYPMLHLLRESSLEQAIKHYPNPELIPERNIELTRELGLQTMQALLAACYKV
ncbi:MAG: DUF1415 domain-containing protein [Methylococcaceae bacterium]